MIAVLVNVEEQPVVREFFELFKTPWKFFDGGPAEVVICARTEMPETGAKLVLIYDGQPNNFDRKNGIPTHPASGGKMFAHEARRFPIYGNCLAFGNSGEPAMREIVLNGRTFIRIGYDLFSEIRGLLTSGQPVEHAQIPALENHIALLRRLLQKHSIPLVEIPPVPASGNFIACLTHDVDHVGIRNHRFDHTMFGFLYRATVGSAIDVVKGKKSLKQFATNCAAALSLPFVHLQLARDFWLQFDRYAEIESGLKSTFFVIPKKGEPGQDAKGNRPAWRASKYDVARLTGQFKKLQIAGHEIGVHGLEAWRDSALGREEREHIGQLTGATELGVRMHWLFFNEHSPVALEHAGFSYDSTVGYNETVGYHAGTTQVFKPLSATRLLELPMHVMDTALFYPTYLNLSPQQAEEAVHPLIANAAEFGGVLTVNWHDRSIAPERLWGDFYLWLLAQLKTKGAWFATAAQTVSWFRRRRDATFETTSSGDYVKIKISAGGNDTLPGLRVRIFKPGRTAGGFEELPLQNGMEISLVT